MAELFLNVVNLSISAGWLVLAVLVLRLVLKKAPKWIIVLLWGIVALRLICPFSIESALSLIPSRETISPEIMMDWTPEISTGIEAVDRAVNPVISTSFAPEPLASANPLQILIPVAANFWLLGVLAMMVYTAVSYFSLRLKLRTAVVLRENIFQCEYVRSPFVLGIIKPRIYLPYTLDGPNLDHVIAHEQAHISRKDHWWKPLGFVLLSVYWVNPLMWVAYILLCRDIEFACDEKVIAQLPYERRADYSEALIAGSVNRRMISACPLAFGEVGVKERVKSVLNYKKPAFWGIITALAVCAVVAVCFLTDPNPPREFAMKGQNLSQLEPDAIVDRILDIEDWDSSDVYVNSNNFSLTVDYDFDWVDSQAVRYFFTDARDIYSAQLRIFPDEGRYILTEPSEWVEQKYKYLLRNYLEALKYLPQDAVSQMAPADIYLVELADKGRPSDYERLITYTPNGVEELEAWFIHLRLSPLHWDGEGYSGEGKDVLDLFFGPSGKSQWGYIAQNTPSKYYLTLSVDGVYSIEIITDGTSGGCVNADGTQFKIGERVYLEQLDGYTDLRGVKVIAYDRNDVVLAAIAIPKSENDKPVNAVSAYGLFLAPEGVGSEMVDLSEQGLDESVTMIPTDTDLQGIHAGALLLPMNGNTYRYLLTDTNPDGVTADKYLGTFTEDGGTMSLTWRVYSLKEYPDLSAVLMVSNSEASWLCTYYPPGRCADDALEQAIDAGYVVMEEGIGTHGQDVWKDFYERSQNGQPASVVVAKYRTLDPDRCDDAYYETFKQDYPHLSVYHLVYDGEKYTLSYKDYNETYSKTYEYLMKYDTTEFYSMSSELPEGRYSYVLTHDDMVTWDRLFHGLVSSQMGAYIDHFSLYEERKMSEH